MENLESEYYRSKEEKHSLGEASWAYVMEQWGGGKRGVVKPSPGQVSSTQTSARPENDGSQSLALEMVADTLHALHHTPSPKFMPTSSSLLQPALSAFQP